MSIKEIITVPDEILKKISDPVEKIGINEKKLIHETTAVKYIQLRILQYEEGETWSQNVKPRTRSTVTAEHI